MGQGVALMTRFSAAALAFAALVLVGCSKSDPAQSPLLGALQATAKAVVTPKARPAAPASVTRQQIDAVGQPLIRVRIPERGIESFIVRRDTNSGTESWATGDNTVITLRDGVLISTRALTPDLMSAAAPTVAQLSTSGGSHSRSYFVLGDNDSSDRLNFACTMASRGPVSLDLVQRVYTVTHMQETCIGDAGKIINEYWIEADGFIRQSRQWVHPLLGMIEIARLIR